MGSGESRIHVPKGGANGGAAMAIATHNTNSGNVDCLTTRPTKFNSFRIAFIPPLRIELGDTMLQRRFLPFKDNPNAIQNSASSRTHDCPGTCTRLPIDWPSLLSRTSCPCAGGIEME